MGQIGTGSWREGGEKGLPSPAAQSMTAVQGSFSPFWLGCFLQLMPHADDLSCPAAVGKKISRLPGWAPRVLWGLLLVLL